MTSPRKHLCCKYFLLEFFEDFFYIFPCNEASELDKNLETGSLGMGYKQLHPKVH